MIRSFTKRHQPFWAAPMIQNAVLIILLLIITSSSVLSATIYTGRVVGPDQKPIQGAKVTGNSYSSKATAVTDKQGRYQCSFKTNSSDSSIPEKIMIYVTAPGYAIAFKQVEQPICNFQLDVSRQVHGLVKDESGKSVSGAIVRLLGIYPENGDPLVLRDALNNPLFSTKTTADGKWSFNGIPASGKVFVLLDDPRFIQTYHEALLGAGDGDPIIAVPGSTVKGRVLYENRKPAKGIIISAQIKNGGCISTLTDAKGYFKIPSLSSGQLKLTVTEKTGTWVTPVRDGIQIQVKQLLTIPDIILTQGAILQGYARDELTGKPRPGILINVSNSPIDNFFAGELETRTDRKGFYRLHVVPQKSTITTYNADTIPGNPSYRWRSRRLEPAVVIDFKKGETKQLDFKIKPEAILTGTAVDESGKPVPNISLSVSMKDPAAAYFNGRSITFNDGSFHFKGLTAGDWVIRFIDPAVQSEWAIVGKSEYTLPLTQPVRLVLKKKNLTSFQGQVTTPKGTPVSGAAIAVRIDTISQDSDEPVRFINHRSVITNTDGQFTVDKLHPSDEVILTPARTGYAYLSGGEVSSQEGIFHVNPIIMQSLDGKISGKVIDQSGSPVSGATVFYPDGSSDAKTVTDSNGRFSLNSILPGEIYLVAVKGTMQGSLKTQSDRASVEIKLSPVAPIQSNDLTLGANLIREVWKREPVKYRTEMGDTPVELVPYDIDLAEKIAKEPDGTIPDVLLARLITTLAVIDPVRAQTWGPERLDLIKEPRLKLFTTSILGMTMISQNLKLANQLYQQAKSIHDSLPTVKYRDDALLIAFAAKLGSPDLEPFFKKATDDLYSNLYRSYYNSMFAEIIAIGSLEYAQKILPSINENQRGLTVGEIIKSISVSMPDAAKKLLLGFSDPTDSTSQFYYGQSAPYVIKAIGAANPQEALQLAREVKDTRYQCTALAAAAQYQPKEEQLRLLKEAAYNGDNSYESIEKLPQVAAQAYELDPVTGREIFELAKRQIHSEPTDRDCQSANFAFYYSRVDPGESRMLLESELAKLLKTIEINENASSKIEQIALAMVPINLERAQEIAALRPYGYRTKTLIAQYVLATEQARKTINFYEWCNAQNWDTKMPMWGGFNAWRSNPYSLPYGCD